MKRLLPLLTLGVLLGVPLSAGAQTAPGPNGPPPDVRAKMTQVRADAKTNALNALSVDHRAAVQRIIDQVAAGTLTDGRAAAQQIDAVLTPAEQKGVLAARDGMRTAMRNAMGTPPDGAGAPPPGAPGGPPERPDGARGRMNDPGFFLLRVSLTREQLHAAMPRPSAAP